MQIVQILSWSFLQKILNTGVVFDTLYIHMYSWSKKKDIPINSNKNCYREIKLVPINMDFFSQPINMDLLQFDALKCFVEVLLHRGGSLPNFNFFFNANP